VPTPYAINADRANGVAGKLTPRDLVSLGGIATTVYGGLARVSKPGVTIAPVAGSGADFDIGTNPSGINPADTSAVFAAALASGNGVIGTPGLYPMYAGVATAGNGLGLFAMQGGPAESSVVPQTPIGGKFNIVDYRAGATTDLFKFSGNGIALDGVSFFAESPGSPGQGTAQTHIHANYGSSIRNCNFFGGGQAGAAGLTDVGLLLDDLAYATVWASTFQGANADNILVTNSGTDNVELFSVNVRKSVGNAIHVENIGGGPMTVVGGNYTNCGTALYLDCVTIPGFIGSIAVYGGQYDSCNPNNSLGQYGIVQFIGTTTNQYCRYVRFYGTGIENESASNLCYAVYITAQMKDVMFQSCSINRSYYDNVYLDPWAIGQTPIVFLGGSNYNPSYNYSVDATPQSCWNVAGNSLLVIRAVDFGYTSDYEGSGAGEQYGITFPSGGALTSGFVIIDGGSVQQLSSVFANLGNAYPGPNQGRYSRITNLAGYNPVRLLGTQPGTSTSAVTNNLATTGIMGPVEVHILIGSTATTVKKNGTFITGSLTNSAVTVSLDVQETVTLSQTTNVSWEWFGC